MVETGKSKSEMTHMAETTLSLSPLEKSDSVLGLSVPSSWPEQNRDRPVARRQKRVSYDTGSQTPFCGDLNPDGMRLVYNEKSFDRLRMPRSPHWAVVWSDLMMTMFILFAVLYIYKTSSQEIIFGEGNSFDIGSNVGTGVMGIKGGGAIGPAGEPAEEQLEEIYEMSRLALDATELQEFATVDLASDKTVRIVLTGDLLFDSGKAEIKGVAQDALKQIIPFVSQSPYMINVVGHTDDVPIQTGEFPSNWELSLIRAGKVARFLMQETHLDENRFYVTGHASFEPVVPNDTPANRAANRRVEIILTKDKPTVSRAGAGDEE